MAQESNSTGENAMNAFDVAANSLINDLNLRIKALYCPIGSKPQEVAVIVHKPDVFQTIGESVISAPTITIDVILSHCPNVQAGDQFVIDGWRYMVQGEPRRDSANVTIKIDLCAI